MSRVALLLAALAASGLAVACSDPMPTFVFDAADDGHPTDAKSDADGSAGSGGTSGSGGRGGGGGGAGGNVNVDAGGGS